MWIRTVFLTCVLTCIVIGVNSQLPQPPRMTDLPKDFIFYKDGESVVMLCKGDGHPTPKFTWLRDGKDFDPVANDNRMVQLPDQGTIVINKPEAKDESLYQCVATNDHGRAVSTRVNLRRAVIENFAMVDQKPPHVVQPGQSLKLPCTKPTSYPSPSVTWIVREEQGGYFQVYFDSRITMDIDDTLIITNVMKQDEQRGKAYHCVAINAFMRKTVFGEAHKIKVVGAPVSNAPYMIYQSPPDYLGVVNESVSLKCIFGGNPTPSVMWARAGNKPIDTDRHKRSSFGMELVIRDLRVDDAGTYQCSASSAGHNPTRAFTITLAVQARPIWVIKPKDQEKAVGQDATFACRGRAVPTPSVRVTIDGRPYNDLPTDRQQRLKISSDQQGYEAWVILTFTQVQKMDSCVIQCNISNLIQGELEMASSYIFTNAYLNILQDAPAFIQKPLPLVKATEGNRAVVFCRTTGKPDATIAWFKGNQPVTGGRYITMPNGDLVIEEAVQSDAGLYRCKASNRYGEIEAQGNLVIRRKTYIQQAPLDIEVILGLDAKFTCSGTTDSDELENLRIIWMKDERPIKPNNQRMTTNIQDNSLTVSGTILRDSGRYSCNITNGLDFAVASASLTVKGPPDAPEKVYVQDNECQTSPPASAVVHWSAGSDNNSPILLFIVEYNTSYTPDTWIYAKKVSKGENSVRVELSPYARYTFRVRSRNRIGDSVPSKHTTRICDVQQHFPTSNPANVRTIGEHLKNLSIYWTPMTELQHNGPNFEYRVEYKAKGANVYEAANAIPDYTTDHLDIRIDSAQPYQPYYIRVRSHNVVGFATVDAPEILGHTGEDRPLVIVDNLMQLEDMQYEITSTSAVFAWRPLNLRPDENENDRMNIRGEFKGYKLQYWKTNEQRRTFREIIVPASQFIETRRFCPKDLVCVTLGDLTPYSEMEAQVVVMNNFYIGPPSNRISFTTKEGVPGPVKKLSATVAGPNHFRLDWLPPDESDRNGRLVGYDIGYQTVDGLDLGKLVMRDPAIWDPQIYSTIISGLLANQRYRIHLWALTDRGRGEDYYIEVRTTEAGPPDAPVFHFARIDEHMLNVTWELSTTAGGRRAGSVFYVEYRKKGISEWMQTSQETVQAWSNVTSLESGTRYEVRVATTTGEHTTASAIQEVTTLGVGAVYVPTAQWFAGMIVIILLIIIIIILVLVLVLKMDRSLSCLNKPKRERQPVSVVDSASHPYTSPYLYPVAPSDEKPPTRGYSNAQYTTAEDEREATYRPPSQRPYQPEGYYNEQFEYGEGDGDSIRKSIDDSAERRPPSYDGDANSYRDEMEDANWEPNKFDNRGEPVRRSPRDNRGEPVRRSPRYNRYDDDDDATSDRFEDDDDYNPDGRDDDRYDDEPNRHRDDYNDEPYARRPSPRHSEHDDYDDEPYARRPSPRDDGPPRAPHQPDPMSSFV